LETVTNGVRAKLDSADIDWTPGGTDGVRAWITSHDTYIIEHMKAGAAAWTPALTGNTSHGHSSAAFGVQLFSAGDDAFADMAINQV
jgi:hypothetical protein